MEQKQLIAIVRQNSTKKGFVTDFFLKDEKGIRGVNNLLGKMIENFNASQKEKAKETGDYFMTIPIKSNGYSSMTYSFGCGNTHYLQQSVFVDICKASPSLCKELPLDAIEPPIQVFLPKELTLAQELYDFQF